MNYLIAADTDIGITKTTNQDSLSVKILQTQQGRMVFAILCDGMGGLEKGEVASASLVRAFDEWVRNSLPSLCNLPLEDAVIRAEWEHIIQTQNASIQLYGEKSGVTLGTTAVVMLLTSSRYYLLNVGDSRAYVIGEAVKQLTKDQTLVEREMELGNITKEQALSDPRRSVLLQCVGANPAVYPDLFFGDVQPDMVYMLCSDGFRHEITEEEIYGQLAPQMVCDEYSMKQNIRRLIEWNKERQEKDNISVIVVRTF